jgi:hypothetical protein
VAIAAAIARAIERAIEPDDVVRALRAPDFVSTIGIPTPLACSGATAMFRELS